MAFLRSFIITLAIMAPSFKLLANAAVTPRSNKCSVWYDVLKDIQNEVFDGSKCGEEAHESIRLAFHDAISYSPRLGGGGADGSIMMYPEIETKYAENAGLDDIVHRQRPFALKHGVSFGDIIQFANAVALSNCEGGPRVPFYAGRSNYSQPSPDNLVPAPFHSVDQILGRMSEVGFDSDEVVALLAAHSVAAQDQQDTSMKGSPLDSTPSVFDGQFYLETMTNSPPEGVFRIPADRLFATDPRTVCLWQTFVDDHNSMVNQFSRAMVKLAAVGQDHASLYDCSEAIPAPRRLRNHRPKFPYGQSAKHVHYKCTEASFPQAKLNHDSSPVPPVQKS
ncbi:manganese peroxidase 2 [Pluteus cervinus]|uniref:Manganese peroxidase 2 n=1 Tax=Pluteus cervinus TaxID=181527 RepID=A0ACD3AQP8_9AGAR|nr:manganese peroxidase 2 [Pluteus cervinus]